MDNYMKKITSLEIGAAYVRVSTDDQIELSPDAQVRVIMDTAKEDGFLIPEEFIFIEKKGVSGRKANNRPEFQRMIALAKSQNPAPFKRLYVWKFSRFARNQEESVFYKSILRKKCGVSVKSVSEPIMEGMFGRLIESIIEWFDEYYSINLSGEVLRGMTEKALRNGYQSAPPLGYKAVGEGKPFVIDEEKIELVNFVFTSYHEGKDISAIAREMNRRGWMTKRNNPFERRTVYRILTNRFYMGEVSWNGITFQGSHELHPDIVSVFEENQQRISQEYHPIGRREASACKHWLSGLLICSFCGASLSFQRTNNPKKRSDYFQCWKYAKGFHPESNAVSVRKAEKAILNSFQTILDTGEIEYEWIPKNKKQVLTEEEKLKNALARIDMKEQRVKEAYENGIDTLDEYKKNKIRLSKERQQFMQELDKLNQSSITEKLNKADLLKRIQYVYDMVSDPEVSTNEKGNAVRSVIKQVTYNKTEKNFSFFYYT